LAGPIGAGSLADVTERTKRWEDEMSSEQSAIRELDHRSGDGIDVTLLWDAGNNAVFVEVADERADARFRIAVDEADALDAFTHPYAYRTIAAVAPARFTASTRR
jgi:hypothetical protein